VALLYPQTPGSLFVASYDSQCYGGGILTRLHDGTGLCTEVPGIYNSDGDTTESSVWVNEETNAFVNCLLPREFVLYRLKNSFRICCCGNMSGYPLLRNGTS
jgi:hypothetical protein